VAKSAITPCLSGSLDELDECEIQLDLEQAESRQTVQLIMFANSKLPKSKPQVDSRSFEDLPLSRYYNSDERGVLQEFYRPIIERTVRYGRAVGYFQSTTLRACSRELISSKDAQALNTEEVTEHERAQIRDELKRQLITLRAQDGQTSVGIVLSALDARYALRPYQHQAVHGRQGHVAQQRVHRASVAHDQARAGGPARLGRPERCTSGPRPSSPTGTTPCAPTAAWTARRPIRPTGPWRWLPKIKNTGSPRVAQRAGRDVASAVRRRGSAWHGQLSTTSTRPLTLHLLG
jgi:hypothetical protein